MYKRQTYNMAVNLVATVGRGRARSVLEQSFAQFQADRGVVAASRTIQRHEAEIAALLAAAACDRGDFASYAGLRQRVREVEADAARARRTDRRAEAVTVLLGLKPGDIINVPHGRHEGWAAVVDPGLRGRSGPEPTVMTDQRQLKKLTGDDFPTPPLVVGKVRVPKHFDAHDAAHRRNLAAAFLTRLKQVDLPATRHRDLADVDAVAEIEALRIELRAHPCHGCPDREEHARVAEQAMRLERETEAIRRRDGERSNSIARAFDRICGVLEALGYLGGERGDELTPQGRTLTRIYGELDLVTAECVRGGVFDDLTVPQLAAVLSTLVFESRAADGRRLSRMPDRPSEAAQSRLRQVWREVGLVERDHRVERGPEPDIGFAEAAYAWASGESLGEVVENHHLTAGDFVRWVRQVIDAAAQLTDAVGSGPLRDTCRGVVSAMRRGVIAVEAD